jgi:RNA polymerase sigma factor (sigma-70 family)
MAATAVPFRSRRRPRTRSLRRVGDERLVARVRAGDDDAFEAIYDRYYLGLLAFCRHMLGSRHEAEDALQHSFASAYRALRRDDAVVDLRPWLYTIARNRCLSALRARREELDLDRLDIERGSLDGLPMQIQVRSELRDLVDDLQRLPDDQRAALVLFELGDHSHDEIAAVLGVRREKVKALVFQARSGLLRARRARDASCVEIREQIAGLLRGLPKRGLVRAHVDRCPACAEFEREVRRQRSALAAILPVVPSAGLKATVLGVAVGGGGGAAAITGATAGGAAVGGGVAALGTAGVATVAGGIVTGGTHVGTSALGAKGLMTKLLTVVAVAGGGGEARQAPPQTVAAAPAAMTLARDMAVGQAPQALTARRHATQKHMSHAPPTLRWPGGPADPALPLTVPAPDTTQADVTSPAAALQHPATQPAAAPALAIASAPAPAPDPAAASEAPAPTPTPTPAPASAPASSDPAPAPTDATPTAPAATTATDSAPAATASTSTDPSSTATTLSASDPPAPASAPAAAAAVAQS